MSIIDIITERKIQEAIQSGELQALPGQGKPIEWKEYPHVPEEQRLAFHLLQNNGFALPWIEKAGEIRQEIDRFRISLSEALNEQGSEPDFESSMTKWTQRLELINRKIIDYNRGVPLDRFQINPLDLRFEIERAQPTKRDNQ